MLQMVRARRQWSLGERPRTVRLAVVLTAWDAVDSHLAALGPDHYLRERLSLLHDFVWSNFGPTSFRCFGLSATGKDLEKDDSYSQRFRDRESSLSKVFWSTSGDEVHEDDDVSLPFAWAIAGDAALQLPA